ncbi:MAG: hypothetical protein J2P50_06075 [Hyphomicrobiaceae bacterium]|nr:hypothetical protein [Hyphomicrobiaceae bacterium]
MIKRHSYGPSATPTTAGERGQSGEEDAKVRERIGHELRSLFEDVVGEPVPERFRRLLQELERNSSKKS